MQTQYYSLQHKDPGICKASSSGGAFTAITDRWLEDNPGGVVYGCRFDRELTLHHVEAADSSQRDTLRGSKYIGSDTGRTFREAGEKLKQGIPVCYCGTPCQIAGLKKVLDVMGVTRRENLLTLEFVCHGVASSRFFKDYIAHLEKRYKSKTVSCSFRGKSRPGKRQDMRVEFGNGKVYTAATTRFDWFYSAYHKNLVIRPSCFQCPFAAERRQGDIVMADHWGDAPGQTRSLVFAETETGKGWLEKALEATDYISVTRQDFSQPQLSHPTLKPEGYDAFWQLYDTDGYLAAQKRLGNNTPAGRLKSAAATLADRLGFGRKGSKG